MNISTPPRLLALFIVLLTFAGHSHARDTLQTYPVDDTLENARLDGVTFYFGPEAHPPVEKQYGEFTSNRKTNAFRKDDRTACDWAFLTALLAFKERALQMGGNAVINMRSYYKKNDYQEAGNYQCGAGNIMAGVTMKGEIVKLAE